MTSVLAAVRPDSWNFPLFVHVLGAMILVGGTLTAASARASPAETSARFALGYWSLLAVVASRLHPDADRSQWIYSKEGLDDAPIEDSLDQASGSPSPTPALCCSSSRWSSVASASAGSVAASGTGLLKATMVISIVLLAAYVVAIWAMSAKPG